MPAMLREPGVAAASDENTIRSASPGVIAPPSAIEAMSKSKSSMRRRYWAASTIRERASMPSRFRFAWNGCVCGCSDAW